MRSLVSVILTLLPFVDLTAATLTRIASLTQPVSGAAAFALPDGRVALIGGGVHVFDPRTLSTITVPHEIPIFSQAAAQLHEGQILVAGGAYTGIQSIGTASWGNNRAELFNSAGNAIDLIGRMNRARMEPQATVLADGRVLITGGWTAEKTSMITRQDVTDGAEIFDPATNAFRPVGSMRIRRFGHTATLLRDGRVLITGGQTEAPAPVWPPALDSTEVFDPVTETFTDGPVMRTKRMDHTATLLEDGRVLIAGGIVFPESDRAASPSTELFHPATNELALGPDLGSRWNHTATRLRDGRVLLFGGAANAIVYDPVTNRVVEKLPFERPRRGHAASLLEEGSVLIFGGGDSEATSDVLRFVPYVAPRRRAVR